MHVLLHTHSTQSIMNSILSASVVFYPISVHPHRLSMPTTRCMSDHSTIQRSLRKTNIIPQKAFHVMCVSQKYPPTISELITVLAVHHSSGGKGNMIKQSSTKLKLRHTLFQPHKLSIQVMIFRLP